MHLCDTNIISELAGPKPNPGVLQWADQLKEISISVVTVEEIYFGLAWKTNARIREWFDHFFEKSTSILPITEAIAKQAGQLRGSLKAGGQTRTQADMLIAATARMHQYTLVTRNLNDFQGCSISLLNPFQ